MPAKEHKRPGVGVGCLIMRHGKLLLVRSRKGFWSPPGGKLEFGEEPPACAAREMAEETGLVVTKIEFVAITSEILAGSHWLTIWMRADGGEAPASVPDPEEITGLGWFALDALPEPLHLDLQNLLAGRCWPRSPRNLPWLSDS